LGEITKSLQSSKVSDKFSYKLDIEKTTALTVGAEVNDTGFEIGIEQKNKLGVGASVEDVNEVKSTLSYA
jgi:hypothetical protein